MAHPTQQLDWRAMVDSAGPYPLPAFNFVQEGLTFTSNNVFREPDPMALQEMERHVSGQELCMGLKNYALEQFGMLAPVVLRKWNINRTDDFGRIVFAMIEAELMSSSKDTHSRPAFHPPHKHTTSCDTHSVSLSSCAKEAGNSVN